MSVDYKIIGQRIKSRRRLCNITQENIAEKLNVSVGYISQIERGIAHANLDMLSNISSLLKCDITELLSDTTYSSHTFLTTEFSEIFESLDNKQRKTLLEIAYVIKNNK